MLYILFSYVEQLRIVTRYDHSLIVSVCYQPNNFP
jgi:hypothetical protein